LKVKKCKDIFLYIIILWKCNAWKIKKNMFKKNCGKPKEIGGQQKKRLLKKLWEQK
jgi:hypothetical protein